MTHDFSKAKSEPVSHFITVWANILRLVLPQDCEKMFLWWMTLCLSCNPLTTILSRIILCAAVTKPSENSTLAADSVNATPVTLEVVDATTTTARKIPSLISGVYNYDSSINFDRYLQVENFAVTNIVKLLYHKEHSLCSSLLSSCSR